MTKKNFVLLCVLFFCPFGVKGEDKARILSLEEFVSLSAKNDTMFEEILADELALQYKKNLALPARDLVVTVKSDYAVFQDPHKGKPDVSVSLEKLFPFTGTQVSAGYTSRPSALSTKNFSDFSVLISQPIARNAFGRTTKYQDKLIGAEIQIAQYQITEAYEDYLAQLMVIYCTWHEAYHKLKIGESSYQENLKLLRNVHDRRKSKIALPIDVNKIKLQVLAKKEKLVDLKNIFERTQNLVQKAIQDKTIYQPDKPSFNSLVDFSQTYARFKKTSRTAQILALMEKKSALQVSKNAHELLPSIALRLGYEREGTGWDIAEKDEMFYGGILWTWPVPHQNKKAAHSLSRVNAQKTRLASTNTYRRLYTDLENLSLQIQRERHLMDIAQEKIQLSRSILKDETENYSFGKVTLNDYIQAVNALDTHRFSRVVHDSQEKKLLIEWLRLTDQLLTKNNKK